MAIVISYSCFRVNSYTSYANVGLCVLVASTETCGWPALGMIIFYFYFFFCWRRPPGHIPTYSILLEICIVAAGLAETWLVPWSAVWVPALIINSLAICILLDVSGQFLIFHLIIVKDSCCLPKHWFTFLCMMRPFVSIKANQKLASSPTYKCRQF